MLDQEKSFILYPHTIYKMRKLENLKAEDTFRIYDR